jgi:hypothetical protein
VSEELAAANRAHDQATRVLHLERAHVLGQASTREHVRTHFHMLTCAWRHGEGHEVAGQLFRLIGAAALTGIGMVPAGNTGGANVSPFQRMTIPPDLARLIASARLRE